MKVNKEQLRQSIEDIICNGIVEGEEVDITTQKVIEAVEPLIIALEVLPETKDDTWISKEIKPEELGFYLCFLIEVNDLGISRYQDLVWFNGETFDNTSVSCYRYLPPHPTEDNLRKENKDA